MHRIYPVCQSPDTPLLSCFHVSVRLPVRSSHALSHLHALFRVGAWCSDPGTHVLSFGFVSGSDTRARIRLAVRSPVHVSCVVARSSCFYRLRAFMLCIVLCGTQLVYFIGCMLPIVMFCVNMWLMSIIISCVFVSCSAHGW